MGKRPIAERDPLDQKTSQHIECGPADHGDRCLLIGVTFRMRQNELVSYRGKDDPTNEPYVKIGVGDARHAAWEPPPLNDERNGGGNSSQR
jgi:hypothetical protein